MNAWLQQAIERGQGIDDWLSPARARALEALSNTSWPTRRTESWKYTSLTALEQLDLTAESAKQQSTVEPIPGVDCLDLVFKNGVLQTNLAQMNLPAGLQITSVQTTSAVQQVIATTLFSQIKPKHHLFGLVNDALAGDVLFIDIEQNSHIGQPIRIISLSTGGHESHHRVLVRLGNQAKATLIEQALGQQNSLSTGFTECDLGEQAELEHYRLAMHTGEAIYFGGCHFCLHHHANLNSTLIGYGSQLSRTDIDIIHNGEHAKAKLNAIYLLGESEHFDLHSTIEHAKPNGTTEENVRGIVGDKANAVFNGRIHIHRDAQKTLAELNNRNLLLSRRGQINTKPELEIYADDVQCAHGATVAEIEEEALYYLMSRGISRSKALVMLNYGFIQELINQMPNQQLAQWLEPQLRARFKEMEVR
ncbi:Fe-S cluster assembly protein SufD [Alkalimonas amylolytica]|uniref:Iron-regulated ABC transporter permease protein SufD n=1 Tax=Alkalimonas amylolytica TaxID=152573 RepID=A0A1H4BC77_ALKAM|nr:Fe-S cluster assembly protein SufD [Alkalimonas amylolytica]SEA45412.1 Iron-regulated ABC transporter permease protein SufD [Alkalimonas amylolytica]